MEIQGENLKRNFSLYSMFILKQTNICSILLSAQYPSPAIAHITSNEELLQNSKSTILF